MREDRPESIGLTAGKSRIENGAGTFTDVRAIVDVLRSCARGEAGAGLPKPGSVKVLTESSVSLALSGSAQGIDFGVSLGKFTPSNLRQDRRLVALSRRRLVECSRLPVSARPSENRMCKSVRYPEQSGRRWLGKHPVWLASAPVLQPPHLPLVGDVSIR